MGATGTDLAQTRRDGDEDIVSDRDRSLVSNERLVVGDSRVDCAGGDADRAKEIGVDSRGDGVPAGGRSGFVPLPPSSGAVVRCARRRRRSRRPLIKPSPLVKTRSIASTRSSPTAAWAPTTPTSTVEPFESALIESQLASPRCHRRSCSTQSVIAPLRPPQRRYGSTPFVSSHTSLPPRSDRPVPVHGAR